MHVLRSGPLLRPVLWLHCSQQRHHHPLAQHVCERHQKWRPRKCQQMHKLGLSSPFTVQSRRLPWWQRRWRLRSCSSLDEHVQLRHAHFIHQSRQLKRCGQCQFLEMWMEDWLVLRPSLDLQVPFLLRSMISLGSLQSFLSLVHLQLATGESSARPSDLQFLHYVASRLYQWDQ